MGCNDATGPDAFAPPEAAPTLPALIVSNPASASEASIAAVRADDDVYVSLPPGSMPDGGSIRIANRRTGEWREVQLVNGGLDPRVVPARGGDTLDLQVSFAYAPEKRRFISVVPVRRPPVIVRTVPPRGKKDVPLNARLLVVFSEPISEGSLTAGSIVVTQGGAPVAGTLGFGADRMFVIFIPSDPFTPETDFEMHISGDVRDTQGDKMGNPATVAFTTEAAISAMYHRASWHSVVGFDEWITFRTNGRFEIAAITQWGLWRWAGDVTGTPESLSFVFDRNRGPGAPWFATASTQGDSIHIRYNVNAGLSGFDDGWYVRIAPIPLPPPSNE
jgi:hypothetical protein